MRAPVSIRELTRDDFPAVIEIDQVIRGFSRPDFWRRRFMIAEFNPPWASLVAELDNRVVGFVLGWSSCWEFGLAGEVGWLDIIGVHPTYRREGIGRALVTEFMNLARNLRQVERVLTLVDPEQFGTMDFFSSIGFARGELVHLKAP